MKNANRPKLALGNKFWTTGVIRKETENLVILSMKSNVCLNHFEPYEQVGLCQNCGHTIKYGIFHREHDDLPLDLRVP
jgi:hypothetical protein